MLLEKGKIPGYQLLFIVASFIVGSTAVVIPGHLAGHDIWLAFILGFLESVIFTIIYTTLSARFPGQTPAEFNDLIFGPWLGKIISLLEIWFLLQLAAVIFRVFGDFFLTADYRQTPILVIVACLAMVAASAVRNGVELIGRCSSILLAILILTTLTTTALLISKMKITNFLPLMEVSLPVLLKSGHEIAAVPFGEAVAFMMFLPYLNKHQGSSKFVFFGMALGLAILLTAQIRNTAVLGPLAEISVYPSAAAIRQISLAHIITRLEIIFIVNLLLTGFIKISVLYYSVVLGISQVFKLRTYLPLVYPVGVIIVALSIISFDNVLESRAFSSVTAPIYFIPFELFLPLLSLITAIARGKSGTGQTASPQTADNPKH